MLEIEKVEIAEALRDGLNASLDAPAVGSLKGMVFRVAGWLRLPRGSAIPRVRMHLAACPGAEPLHWELREVACHPRADIACHDWEVAFGFDGYVDAVRLPRTFRVLIDHRRDSEKETPIAEIRGRRTFISGQYDARFQPIAVYHGGRMGSTAIMRALLAHPEIVVGDKHPFENNTAGHIAGVSMSLLRTASTDDGVDARWKDMRRLWDRYGSNPSLSPNFQDHADIETVLETLSGPVGDFARSSIDRAYELIARHTRKSDARFFAEKETRPDTLNALLWLYPRVKLILLTRDPRDVVRSARDFNTKRAEQGFGRALVENDAEWLNLQGRLLCSFVDVFDNHPADYRLHVSFEEFMADTAGVLRRVCEFLDVDHSSAMEHAVREETPESKFHRTRPSGKEIGAWQESLPPVLAQRLVRRASAFMQRFGYDVGPDQNGAEFAPEQPRTRARKTQLAERDARRREADEIIRQRDEMARASENAMRMARVHERRANELGSALNEAGRHAEALARERDEALKFAKSLEASLQEATREASAERDARERQQSATAKYVAALRTSLREHAQAWRAAQAEVNSLSAVAIAEREARERLKSEADDYVASVRAEAESLRTQALAEREARERLESEIAEYVTSVTTEAEALRAQAIGEREARERLESNANVYVASLRAEAEKLRAQAVAERDARARLQAEAEQYIAALMRAMEEHVEVARASQAEAEALRTQAVAEREARERLQANADKYAAALNAVLSEHDQALHAAHKELESLRAAVAERNKPSAQR